MKFILPVAILMALFVFLSQTSCYYDNEVDQYGVTACDTAAVSYANDIAPIIQQNCLVCHQPGGSQESSAMNTYDNLVNFAVSAVDRVNGRGNLMPPSGKMTSCNIALLEAWVNAGMPNN
jgi:mono/diheme cytochrome c family protein